MGLMTFKVKVEIKDRSPNNTRATYRQTFEFKDRAITNNVEAYALAKEELTEQFGDDLVRFLVMEIK